MGQVLIDEGGSQRGQDGDAGAVVAPQGRPPRRLDPLALAHRPDAGAERDRVEVRQEQAPRPRPGAVTDSGSQAAVAQ